MRLHWARVGRIELVGWEGFGRRTTSRSPGEARFWLRTFRRGRIFHQLASLVVRVGAFSDLGAPRGRKFPGEHARQTTGWQLSCVRGVPRQLGPMLLPLQLRRSIKLAARFAGAHARSAPMRGESINWKMARAMGDFVHLSGPLSVRAPIMRRTKQEPRRRRLARLARNSQSTAQQLHPSPHPVGQLAGKA